jgi:hypothetical protein
VQCVYLQVYAGNRRNVAVSHFNYKSVLGSIQGAVLGIVWGVNRGRNCQNKHPMNGEGCESDKVPNCNQIVARVYENFHTAEAAPTKPMRNFVGLKRCTHDHRTW